MTRAIWGAAAIAACAAGAAGVGRAAPLDARCEARVGRLEERLSAVVADEDDLKSLRILAALPQASHGVPAGGRAPVIGVEGGAPTLDGARVGGTTAAEWRQELETRLATLQSVAPGKSPALLVVVDRTTPLGPLLPLFAGLGPRYELQFVVEPVPNPLARHLPATVPPGALRYRDQRVGLEPGSPEQAKLFGHEVSAAAHGCSTVTRLNEARATPPPERARHFVSLLAGMVRECGCARVDVDAIEYMSIDMFSGFKTPRRVLRVRLTPDAPALALPAGPVTGQSLVTALDRVTKTTQPLRVRLPAR
jgi:hypothetical protein